jgi:hypothetical protein
MLKNKRGVEFVFGEAIFIILNILFISLLIIFVYKSSTGQVVYEQAYAKQIALMIDSAKPGMVISYDISKGMGVAEKDKKISEVLKINSESNYVLVSLGKGGYKQGFFTNYKISSRTEGSKIILEFSEKTAEEKLKEVVNNA